MTVAFAYCRRPARKFSRLGWLRKGFVALGTSPDAGQFSLPRRLRGQRRLWRRGALPASWLLSAGFVTKVDTRGRLTFTSFHFGPSKVD